MQRLRSLLAVPCNGFRSCRHSWGRTVQEGAMTANRQRVGILAIAMALAGSVGGWADGQPASAARAFEQFRRLEGTWRGKSTKGWTDRVIFKTIARGSVVRESSFDSDGGHDAMETLYQMDGSRLVLTHY